MTPVWRAVEVDEWVRRALRENGTIYTIDEPLLRKLQPDVILTQKLCDVCAIGYGTVAKLAQTLPGPPQGGEPRADRVWPIFSMIFGASLMRAMCTNAQRN